MPYANKDADQPAHPCSLISAFVVRCLDSIIPLVSISEISSLYLASVAAQASLSLPWSQTLKTRLKYSKFLPKFQIVFEATRGRTFMSDIALDDIQIIQGSCPLPGSCNFEVGLCGYTNIQGDQFDWTRAKGGTPSVMTGPTYDHTTNSPQG